MQKQHIYTMILTFIFFPLHGGWILERLEGLIATSPTHPPFFKTRAEIEHDVRQCRQNNIPVRKWLHNQYTDRSEKTLSNLLESLDPPMKIDNFRQRVNETKKELLPQISPTRIQYSYCPPAPPPRIETKIKKFLTSIPNKHIVQVVANAPGSSEVQYDNEKKGYILYLNNQQIEASGDAVLQHEYMHVANNDVLVGETLVKLYKKISPKQSRNYLKNREYFADVGYTLSAIPEQNLPKRNPSFWMQESLKHSYKENYKKIGFLSAAGYSYTLFTGILLSKIGNLKRAEIIPFSIISFIPIITGLALLPYWDAFFYGGPNHPSIIERWFAMNTVGKYLRVDQEFEKTKE